jgi:hypothetical protein
MYCFSSLLSSEIMLKREKQLILLLFYCYRGKIEKKGGVGSAEIKKPISNGFHWRKLRQTGRSFAAVKERLREPVKVDNSTR